MKPFSLLGNDYKLPDTSAKFLADYLARIEKYVARHAIDDEYLTDIQSRLAEKLSNLTEPIENKDVIAIVNDLGEPEDIFAEVAPQSTEIPPKKRENDTGLLSRKKKIIFGVSLRLSEDFKIGVLYVRIAFILLIFAGGAGIWIYLALALLIPGIFHLSPSSPARRSAIVVIFEKIWHFIKTIGKWILMFFVLGLALFLFMGGIFASVGGLSLFGYWVLGGQDILSIVTPAMRASIMVASIAMILMSLGLIAFVFRKPIFGRYIWTLLALTLIGSGVVLAAEIPPIVRDFATISAKHTESYPLQYSGTGEIVVSMPYPDRGPHLWGILSNYSVDYDSSGSGVFVEVETTLHGRGAKDSTFDQMNGVSVSLENGRLNIQTPETIFREKVPLTFVEYRVIVHAPKDVLVRSPWGDAYNSRRTRLDDFAPGSRVCARSRYVYDAEREAFYCDPRGYFRETLDQAMYDYAASFSLARRVREQERAYTGSIVASGTYMVDIYDEDTREHISSPVEVFINAKGDMWGVVDTTKSASASGAGVSYKNTEYGFAIDFPENWRDYEAKKIQMGSGSAVEILLPTTDLDWKTENSGKSTFSALILQVLSREEIHALNADCEKNNRGVCFRDADAIGSVGDNKIFASYGVQAFPKDAFPYYRSLGINTEFLGTQDRDEDTLGSAVKYLQKHFHLISRE